MVSVLDTLHIQAAAATPKAGGLDKAKAMEVALEFESMFLADALKSMSAGLGSDPLDGGGTGSQNWRELLMDEYANDMVRRGGIGLAEPIARELLKIQEANPQ